MGWQQQRDIENAEFVRLASEFGAILERYRRGGGDWWAALAALDLDELRFVSQRPVPEAPRLSDAAPGSPTDHIRLAIEHLGRALDAIKEGDVHIRVNNPIINPALDLAGDRGGKIS